MNTSTVKKTTVNTWEDLENDYLRTTRLHMKLITISNDSKSSNMESMQHSTGNERSQVPQGGRGAPATDHRSHKVKSAI